MVTACTASATDGEGEADFVGPPAPNGCPDGYRPTVFWGAIVKREPSHSCYSALAGTTVTLRSSAPGYAEAIATPSENRAAVNLFELKPTAKGRATVTVTGPGLPAPLTTTVDVRCGGRKDLTLMVSDDNQLAVRVSDAQPTSPDWRYQEYWDFDKTIVACPR